MTQAEQETIAAFCRELALAAFLPASRPVGQGAYSRCRGNSMTTPRNANKTEMGLRQKWDICPW